MRFGVLGGIGPTTTAQFYKDVIEGLQASNRIDSNTDFPNIFINSIPAPELTTFEVGAQYLDVYVEGVKKLAVNDPEFIVMACNTVHVYLDEIRKKSGFNNILSIREIVRPYIKPLKGAICVLATPVTIKGGLYNFEDCRYVRLKDSYLRSLERIIKGFVATNDFELYRAQLLEIITHAKALGAEHFLVSCTELSLLLQNDNDINKIDTLELLTNYVIQCCKANR